MRISAPRSLAVPERWREERIGLTSSFAVPTTSFGTRPGTAAGWATSRWAGSSRRAPLRRPGRQIDWTFSSEAATTRSTTNHGTVSRGAWGIYSQTRHVARLRDWCKSLGYSPMNTSNLGKEVKKMFPATEDGRPRDAGSRVQVYRHLTRV